VLYTNTCSLGASPGFGNSLMIPKLSWCSKKRALLTIREMLEGPYWWTVGPEYDYGQTTVVANSREANLLAVEEIMPLIEEDPTPGAMQTNGQRTFDDARAPLSKASGARIADSFAGRVSTWFAPDDR